MSAAAASTTTETATDRYRRLLREYGILAVFLLFITFATAVSSGRFIQPGNLSVILFQTSVIGILALGQTLVMLVAGIDLSIVAIAILAALVMGAGGSERQQEMNLSGSLLPFIGFYPAIALSLAGSAVLGAINGLGVVALRIPPFIVTLAMSLALSGLAMLVTAGTPVNYPDPFFPWFGRTKVAGLPLTVYVFFALAALTAIFLSLTRYGVMIYAIGGNPRAARLSGIPVARITVLVYTLSGLLGGLAGFIFLARTSAVTVGSTGTLLLNTIAAVVVGGISLYGGKGSVLNAVIGVLLLTSLGNLMNILRVETYLQDAVSGLIILIAIMINVRLDRT